MIAHSSVIKNFQQLTESKQINKIWKDRAHEYFDLIWEHRRYTTRSNVYSSLSIFLNKSSTTTHISRLSNTQCKRVIKWSIDILNECTKMEYNFGIYIHSLIKYPKYLY